MTKDWTHDLPVDKGAFEGGNLEGKRADEHISRSDAGKVEIFLRN